MSTYEPTYPKPDRPYPQWVCHECGLKYGRKECGIATWHNDTCGVCGKFKSVTEPRDFSHLKGDWQFEQSDNKKS